MSTRRIRFENEFAVINALVRGVEPVRRPTIAERVAAIRHLAKHGFSDQQIAKRVGRSQRSVIRVRRQHGIAGLPVGTNGFTRPWKEP